MGSTNGTNKIQASELIDALEHIEKWIGRVRELLGSVQDQIPAIETDRGSIQSVDVDGPCPPPREDPDDDD